MGHRTRPVSEGVRRFELGAPGDCRHRRTVGTGLQRIEEAPPYSRMAQPRIDDELVELGERGDRHIVTGLGESDAEGDVRLHVAASADRGDEDFHVDPSPGRTGANAHAPPCIRSRAVSRLATHRDWPPSCEHTRSTIHAR